MVIEEVSMFAFLEQYRVERISNVDTNIFVIELVHKKKCQYGACFYNVQNKVCVDFLNPDKKVPDKIRRRYEYYFKKYHKNFR